MVANASKALKELFLSPEEEQQFLKELSRHRPQLVQGGTTRMSFSAIVRYLTALWDRWGGKLKLVSDELANQRAAICNQCPSQGDVGGCHPCSGLAAKLMGVERHGGVRGKGCLECDCYLEVKVRLDVSMDQREIVYPANCWINQEAEQSDESNASR